MTPASDFSKTTYKVSNNKGILKKKKNQRKCKPRILYAAKQSLRCQDNRRTIVNTWKQESLHP